jgi:predicted Ser/Thr protein kinase
MNERPDSNQLDLEDLNELRLQRLAFGQALLDGHAPRVEEWLSRVRDGLRLHLAEEVIEEELVFARRTTGDYPNDVAISDRHPHLVEHFRRIRGELLQNEATVIGFNPDLWTNGQTVPFSGVDRFRIQSRLGKGGQGETFKAEDLIFGRPVAVKVAELHTAEHKTGLSLNEAQLLGRLRSVRSSNIVTVYDFITIAGYSLIVMEFVEGDSLSALYRHSPVGAHEAARLISRLARAVDAMHAETGIIHRDIKPQNVILTPRLEPVLIDFGLARIRDSWTDRALTQLGLPHAGTPGYMAPEQIVGAASLLDARTDVFGLGATATPATGATAAAILSATFCGTSGPPRFLTSCGVAAPAATSAESWGSPTSRWT